VPPTDQFRLNESTLDIRVYGLPLGGSRLSFGFDLAHLHGDTVVTNGQTIVIEDGNGASGTATLESPFKGGRNKVVLQYGTGPASDFRSIMTKPLGRTYVPGEHVRIDDLWQFRVLNDLLVDQRGPWALQVLALYQEYENGAASNSRIRWVSVGARPVRRLGRFASLAVEAGWDHTEQSGLPGGSLFKLTVAPQITPALKFLSRPSVRAYATWAHWSDSFRGSVAPVTYPDAVQGVAFGVQMEAWW
jgi:maltoporin